MVLKPIRIILAVLVFIVVIAAVFVTVKKPIKAAVAKYALIPNHSMEQTSKKLDTPSAWHTENWGANTTEFTYLSLGHTGKHSLQTTLTSYTNGDAKWYFDPQPVTSGQVYTFKDFYKSDVPSRIVVKYTKKDGSFLYKELKGAQAATDWTQYQASFTVPSEVKAMTIFHLLSSAGFLVIDDYQLTSFVPEAFERGLVSITWDDGMQSQYTKAFPLHKKYNLHGNFFLISGSLDKYFYMTTQQAKEIQKAGNELGSHTVTHSDLSTLNADEINIELQQSQTDLQAKFGTPITDFVTPYGEYNDLIISTVKKYYRSHRSVEEGYNTKNKFDIYNIVVQNVYLTTPPSQVETWVNKAKTDKTWLVLVYHQVDNPGNKYSISSENLDKEFHYLKDSGVPVLTFDQAFKEILPQINEN